MRNKNESALDNQDRCKEWFFDYVVKQNNLVAAFFSAKSFFGAPVEPLVVTRINRSADFHSLRNSFIVIRD